MLPPVTDADQSRQMTPQRTWRAECVRMSRCRRSQSSSAPTCVSTAGSSSSAWIVCQMSSPRFFAPITRQSPPESPVSSPLVGRLAAAAGVEDGAIQEHGVRVGVDLDDGRIGLAQVGIGVAEVLAHAAEDTDGGACSGRRPDRRLNGVRSRTLHTM